MTRYTLGVNAFRLFFSTVYEIKVYEADISWELGLGSARDALPNVAGSWMNAQRPARGDVTDP